MSGRIVVGVDGSGSSRFALRWAADEARRRDADLDVVFAWEHAKSSPPLPSEGPSQLELEAAAVATAQKLLADEGFGGSSDLRINSIVVLGSAVPVLLETAKGADLLVVGSRGRGGFKGMLLGSVSQHCVAHAECPVVVTRGAQEELTDPR